MVRITPLLPLALATGLFFAATLLPAAGVASARLVQKDETTPVPVPTPVTRALTEKERKDATAAIEGQLKAFKSNDWEAATKFQHTSLRKAFNSPADFRQAIQRGFPQFANYKSVTFGDSRCSTNGDRVEIRMRVTGTDGVSVRATYVLMREENEYRVAGVSPDRPTERQDVA